MSDECKILDPTAFGLFFVALVSLPIALTCILTYGGVDNDIGLYLGDPLIIASIFIFIAAIAAYRAGTTSDSSCSDLLPSVCSLLDTVEETSTST